MTTLTRIGFEYSQLVGRLSNAAVARAVSVDPADRPAYDAATHVLCDIAFRRVNYEAELEPGERPWPDAEDPEATERLHAACRALTVDRMPRTADLEQIGAWAMAISGQPASPALIPALRTTLERARSAAREGDMVMHAVWLVQDNAPLRPFDLAVGSRVIWVCTDDSPVVDHRDLALAGVHAVLAAHLHGDQLAYDTVEFYKARHGQYIDVRIDELNARTARLGGPEALRAALDHPDDTTSNTPLSQLRSRLIEFSDTPPDAVTALHVVNIHTKYLGEQLRAAPSSDALRAERRRLYDLKERAAHTLLQRGALKFVRHENLGGEKMVLAVGMTPFGLKGFHLPLGPFRYAETIGRRYHGPIVHGHRRDAELIRTHFSVERALEVLDELE